MENQYDEISLIREFVRFFLRTKAFIFLALICTFSLSTSWVLPSLFPQHWGYCYNFTIIAFLMTFAFWYSIFVLSAVNSFFAYILFPLLVLPHIYFYVVYRFFGIDSSEITIAIYNATYDEVKPYLTLKNLSCFFMVTGLFFSLMMLIRKKKLFVLCSDKIKKYIYSFFVFIVAFTLVALPAYITIFKSKHKMYVWMERVTCLHPLSCTLNPLLSIYEFHSAKSLLDPAEFKSHQFSPYPETLVLYIGESTRADHFPINGYHRNTMPQVCSNPNIISIRNCHSKATSTLAAIPSLLAITPPDSNEPTHKSFINILSKHNFKNYLLIGANTQGKWHLTPRIASVLDSKVSLYSNPKNANEYSEALKEITEKKQPSFILIEDGAGHIPYIAENNTFGQKTKVDKYDNCLIDIDSRLSAIINTLKDQDALVLFISDHGESLGEDGRWYHSGPLTAKEQTHVCCFMWFSEKYQRQRPELIKNIELNSNRLIKHSFVYHTIISLAGIHSEVQILEQDLTRCK